MKDFFNKLLIYHRRNFIDGTGANYETIVTDYVNLNNFSSKTQYFIWVDLKNFKVNIFNGSKNKWKIMNSYLCTIGKKETPTPTGTFTIGVKGLYFGVNKGYKCWYYTQFKGNYLFHSIIYNLDGSIRDGRLGKALSDGCIRLNKINAKWIWDNIPEATKVVIS
ncbi:L,D-transpeptidase [Clostridium botulinum]|uniref:L,D-transpeptidase n=1 Tax=Clostridium botulinum TaxID=1491 RepID=A0A6B4JP57_CLOBO|nr:L,D-transpeptidase [Clostridium botulinum]EES50939.1 ErfK/YbiS/YcfS/YnhG family [Clostridium botulinum E1 str. 'BoNT E Beluga']MBY6761739.1 L,D-transpeptidase [Clostridium botulinum]MBY6920726.1 L,D-transpeptidase [Clostridium botulinum]MCR1131526.1 L,D-transpeptidase [Clostridium botulinum]NFH69648.1 L,D-transpeptidase [Clostridium botulinum]